MAHATLAPSAPSELGQHEVTRGGQRHPRPGETVQLLDRGQTGIQPIDTTLVGGAVGGGWRDGAGEVLEETLVSPGAGPGQGRAGEG